MTGSWVQCRLSATASLLRSSRCKTKQTLGPSSDFYCLFRPSKNLELIRSHMNAVFLSAFFATVFGGPSWPITIMQFFGVGFIFWRFVSFKYSRCSRLFYLLRKSTTKQRKWVGKIDERNERFGIWGIQPLQRKATTWSGTSVSYSDALLKLEGTCMCLLWPRTFEDFRWASLNVVECHWNLSSPSWSEKKWLENHGSGFWNAHCESDCSWQTEPVFHSRHKGMLSMLFALPGSLREELKPWTLFGARLCWPRL